MTDKINESDVGLKSDLIVSLTHLIATENHAMQSYYATKDPQFLELKNITRVMRTKWLDLLVKKNNGAGWCISKHLLASYVTMEEVATRLLSDGKQKEAEEAFEDAKLLIGLFYAINDLQGGDTNVSRENATEKTREQK